MGLMIVMIIVIDEACFPSNSFLFIRLLSHFFFTFFIFSFFLMRRPLLDLRYVKHDDHTQEQQHDSGVLLTCIKAVVV